MKSFFFLNDKKNKTEKKSTRNDLPSQLRPRPHRHHHVGALDMTVFFFAKTVFLWHPPLGLRQSNFVVVPGQAVKVGTGEGSELFEVLELPGGLQANICLTGQLLT